METYWGNAGISPRILNVGTIMEVSGQLRARWKNPGTPWIWVWVGVRAGLDVMAKRIPGPAGNRSPVVQPVA